VIDHKICRAQSLAKRIRPLAPVLMLAVLLASPMAAQTFSALHTFSGPDGAVPKDGLTIDNVGRLYGATSTGGLAGFDCPPEGCGVVFRLAPQGSGWIETPLWDFHGPDDGSVPLGTPVFGPNNLLYGTTSTGGSNSCGGAGCGTVYSLRPGPTACTSALCYWSESVLYSFTGTNGANPVGHVVFDDAGNMYGVTSSGNGGVYQLTPGGVYSQLYAFNGPDGKTPQSGVIFDRAGNLYGTTQSGGANFCGAVYELSPNGSGWTESVLYSFQCAADGHDPIGGLIFDGNGNLYGTTNFGGASNGGTVFELTPSGGGNWTFNLIYSLVYTGTFDWPLYGPTGSLTMDSAGNLYGTAILDGTFASGSVFKLTPSNGGWTYTSLHDFSNGGDGGDPYGSVTLDSNGNLYGTASQGPFGGACQGNGCGTVWEITP
jgi:uncharacterized repeat protein (TIGR03803 family)